jgi:exodeoxyribonuclease VII large subunit
LESQETATKIFSVTELTSELQQLIETRFAFVWLEGEISNFSSPSSGHFYMVMKDGKAQLRAVMFRPQIRAIRFVPENGMKVLARGRLTVYAPRGEYQLVIDYLEPLGAGALALAFEQLKRKLAARGIFDQALKRPLPFLPKKVAVITSPTGAAIRDFLKIIRRRFANIEITILPVRVQGEGAAAEIAHALDLANRALDADVIVLTRGGGSLEDLWAFNEEEVALAIRRSRIPVVSAVGHEIDLTISDMAADVRAPTPSAAAEMLVREKEGLEEKLLLVTARIRRGLMVRLSSAREKLERLSKAVKQPERALEDMWLRLDELHARITVQIKRSLSEAERELKAAARALALKSPLGPISSSRGKIDNLARGLSKASVAFLNVRKAILQAATRQLESLNPLAILQRGYSITLTLPERAIVRSSGQVREGQLLEVALGSGSLICLTKEVKE